MDGERTDGVEKSNIQLKGLGYITSRIISNFIIFYIKILFIDSYFRSLPRHG